MRTLLLVLSVLALVPGAQLQAQSVIESDPGSAVRTRAELERLLSLYEEAMQSPAYSQGVKRSVQASAAQIRERLERGDFRVGDRVALYVEGEPNIPDTVPVEPGPMISLPLFGQISLDGVLRSEIQEHLTREMSQFIRDPVVRASGLMRLSILGSVGRPGFYVVPADMLLSEALMMAGGPAGNADLEDLQIERASTRLMDGDELSEAMRVGRTLDQLNLQAGDQLFVPQQTPSIWGNILLRYALPILTVTLIGVRVYGR